jgi:hypothetical protein
MNINTWNSIYGLEEPGGEGSAANDSRHSLERVEPACISRRGACNAMEMHCLPLRKALHKARALGIDRQVRDATAQSSDLFCDVRGWCQSTKLNHTSFTCILKNPQCTRSASPNGLTVRCPGMAISIG